MAALTLLTREKLRKAAPLSRRRKVEPENPAEGRWLVALARGWDEAGAEGRDLSDPGTRNLKAICIKRGEEKDNGGIR